MTNEPHSIEAERAVLGAVLIDANAWPAVSHLTAADFYRGAHRAIYAALAELDEAGEPMDAVTVAGTLDRAGTLDDAGGLAFLVELADNTPSAANAGAYADRVRELADRRTAMTLAMAVHTAARTGRDGEGHAVSVRSLTDRFMSDLAALAEEAGGGPARRARPVPSVTTEFSAWRLWAAGKGGAVLSAGTVAVIAGEGGIGKSALAGSIALGIAMLPDGKSGDVSGGLFEGAGGPVLLASLEDVPAVTAWRLRKLAGHLDEGGGNVASRALQRVHVLDLAGRPLFGPRDNGRGALYNARPERLVGSLARGRPHPVARRGGGPGAERIRGRAERGGPGDGVSGRTGRRGAGPQRRRAAGGALDEGGPVRHRTAGPLQSRPSLRHRRMDRPRARRARLHVGRASSCRRPRTRGRESQLRPRPHPDPAQADPRPTMRYRRVPGGCVLGERGTGRRDRRDGRIGVGLTAKKNRRQKATILDTELRDALYAADKDDTILKALAAVEWRRAHPAEDCPDDAIPSAIDLFKWLQAEHPNDYPEEVLRDADKFLKVVMGDADKWVWRIIGSDGGCEIGAWRIIFSETCPLSFGEIGTGSNVLPSLSSATPQRIEWTYTGWWDQRWVLRVLDSRADLVSVHTRWRDMPDEDRPRRPLALLVRAWQKRPVEIEADERMRPTAIASKDLFAWTATDGPNILTFQHHDNDLPISPGTIRNESQLCLPGMDREDSNVILAPALALVDAAGFGQVRPGKGARLDKRLTVFSLLMVPMSERRPGGKGCRSQIDINKSS